MLLIVDLFNELLLGVVSIVGRIPWFVVVQECLTSDAEGPSAQWIKVVKRGHLLLGCVCRAISASCCNMTGNSNCEKGQST
jgi:hypothetical protein